MITDDVLSGELYFQLHVAEDKAASTMKVNQSVRTFLKRKDDNNLQVAQLRQKIMEGLLARLNHLENGILSTIKSRTELNRLHVYREKLLAKNVIDSNRERFDYSALQSILQYSSILQQELYDANQALLCERAMKESLKNQAKVTRDLLFFSTHLRSETKGKIELTLLPTSTAQFSRCVKAVHDNLHNCFGFNAKSPLIPDSNNVRIINVFKLKNALLAQNLHKAARKSNGAKMKGLFCCMPVDNVYRFATHGLREQHTPLTVARTSTSNDSVEADNLIRPYFTTPWIFANGTEPLVPLEPALRNMLQTHAGHAWHTIQSMPTQSQYHRPILRFSKYSTLTTLLSYSEEQLHSGICLALCRVLMMRIKTVTHFIEDQDILSAMQQGYDAVYSSLSEEYALLQPNYVLPEFFIHADFTSLKQANLQSTTNNDHSRRSAVDSAVKHTATQAPSLSQAMTKPLPSHLTSHPSADLLNTDLLSLVAIANSSSTSSSHTSVEPMVSWTPRLTLHESLASPVALLRQHHILTLNERGFKTKMILSQNDDYFHEQSRPQRLEQESLSPNAKARRNHSSAASNNQQVGTIKAAPHTTHSAQHNALVKQSALLAIEHGVEDFRRALQTLRADVARRLLLPSQSASALQTSSS